MRIPLPTMQCDDNCGKCCTIVSCHEHEYKAVVDYAAKKGIVPISQGERCPWYQDGKCSVYEVRPFACQMFGHVPSAHCPLGYNNNISKTTEQRLFRQYRDTEAKSRYLHEVLLEQNKITFADYLKAVEL